MLHIVYCVQNKNKRGGGVGRKEKLVGMLEGTLLWKYLLYNNVHKYRQKGEKMKETY